MVLEINTNDWSNDPIVKVADGQFRDALLRPDRCELFCKIANRVIELARDESRGLKLVQDKVYPIEDIVFLPCQSDFPGRGSCHETTVIAMRKAHASRLQHFEGTNRLSGLKETSIIFVVRFLDEDRGKLTPRHEEDDKSSVASKVRSPQ